MRSGPRAWEEGLTRATLNAADRGRVSSKPYINTADCKSLEKGFLLNFIQCWILSRHDPGR